MSDIQEFSPMPANFPNLEKLVPTFKEPYIRLNPGHTKALSLNTNLADAFGEGYTHTEQSQDQFKFMQIPNQDLTKKFRDMPPEDKVAFHDILKQELHAGKMSGLIKAYESRVGRWGEPDITQEQVEGIRKLALEALRQQHAVSNLPPDLIPDGVTVYKIEELEEAALSIDNADRLAKEKNILFASN